MTGRTLTIAYWISEIASIVAVGWFIWRLVQDKPMSGPQMMGVLSLVLISAVMGALRWRTRERSAETDR